MKHAKSVKMWRGIPSSWLRQCLLLAGTLLLGVNLEAQSCYPVPNGLAGWWRAEADATDFTGINNGTLIGGAGFATGLDGLAFNFNGQTAYVDVPNNPSLNPTHAVTLEAWVYPRATGPVSSPVIKKAGEGLQQINGYTIELDYANRLIFAAFVAGTGYIPATSAPLPLNQWSHVAGVFDGTYAYVYVNGALAAPPTLGPGNLGPSGNDLHIGHDPSNPPRYLNGLVDEPAVYSTALSAAQIAAIYSAGAAGKCVVGGAPVVVSQPQTQTVTAESTLNLLGSANGTSPLSYQWVFNGAPLIGATQAQLTIVNVQPTNAGVYSFIVTNAYGVALSSNATVTVNAPAPTITGQPQSLAVNAGNTVNLAVYATGLPVLGFQWQFNGVNLAGATQSSLAITNVQAADGGVYDVIVSNPYGQVVSSNALLVVYTFPPSFLTQPQSGLVQVGASLNLSANAIGSPVLAYQWQFNGADVAGATNPTLSLVNVQPSAAGSYALVVTNLYGAVTSSVATVTVLTPPPSITTQPADLVLSAGGSGHFAVLAAGAAPLAYQWQLNGINLTGATSALLNLSNVQPTNAGVYTVIITNLYGTIVSSNATLTVNTFPPSLTIQPSSFSVTAGATAQFTVLATGSPVLAYQWQLNGTNLPGATGPSLSLTNVSSANLGLYAVTVTNAYGSVTSSNATLTVYTPPCVTITNSPVSWWRAEGDATDAVGSNGGTLVGGATFAPGKVGQAFKFNGTSQYVNVPTSPALNFSTNMTAEAWVYPTSVAGVTGPIIKKAGEGSGQSDGYTIEVAPSGVVYFAVCLANAGWVSVGANLPFNQWDHVAGVFNGTTLIIYVNGVASNPISAQGTILPSGNDLQLGHDPSNASRFFGGLVDEAAVYSTALSPAQVSAIYNAGVGGKCVPQNPPLITGQPKNQTVGTWSNVTFSASVSGTAPFAYQWSWNGLPIAGATNASLSLTNVTGANAGPYALTVANAYGTATSSNATLTVLPPPSLVQVSSVVATSAIVVVPIQLVAQGTENAVGFSVNFTPSKLTFAGIALGTGAGSAVAIFNTNSALSGKIGVALAFPGATTFSAGTQEVAEVSFFVNSGTNPATTTIAFGDVPTARQVSDVLAHTLTSSFASGSVVIPYLGFEGDVSPLPNGDAAVSIIDWVQVGRFVAGLDTITNTGEFQRADCAPRATYGDGQLTVADWVQAGRYAAGLDPLTVAGGPSAPLDGTMSSKKPSGGGGYGPSDLGRVLALANTVAQAGRPLTVPVQLTAKGNENALGFSVQFDPTQLVLNSVTLGAGAAGATLVVNQTQAATRGLAAVLVALPAGTQFPAATVEVAALNFTAALASAAGVQTLTLTSRLTATEVTDVNAASLVTTYQNGVVTITPAGPALRAAMTSGGLVLSWPASATGYVLQTSAGLGAGAVWTTINASPATAAGGATQSVTLPTGGETQRYYRLVQP